MNKKTFTALLIIFFVVITAFHFGLNLSKRTRIPSDTWAKEVLISSGNVQSNPSLIRFKNNYVLVHSDGNKIKVISMDKMGKKLNELQLDAKTSEPLSTNVVTDGKVLNIYWTIVEGGKKTVCNATLDDKFTMLYDTSIHGPEDVISIGENVVVFNYKDNIVVQDFSTGKNVSVPAKGAEFLSGAKSKDTYVISYKENQGDIRYFTVKNGEASEAKTVGRLEDVSSIVYISSNLVADENLAYMMMEYRNKGEFGGTKVVKFSYKGQESFSIDDFKIQKTKTEVSNVIPYLNNEGEAKFLTVITGPYDKKRYYDNIAEYNLTKPSDFIKVSRTKEPSMYPAAVDDMAVFCDVVGKDKFNVYVTSKSEEFKNAANNLRSSEVKLAAIDTISGILFSLVYIIPYGALWVIPAIGIISVYSIFEYKMTAKKKKIGFILVFLSYFIFKSLGIKAISFKRFAFYMPDFMSFGLSLLISLVISLLCGFYAYSRYSSEIEDNIGAASLFMPLVYDTVLTLMVVVPFMV